MKKREKLRDKIQRALLMAIVGAAIAYGCLLSAVFSSSCEEDEL